MNVVDSIDIASLTTSEKLGLMDRLWSELAKDPEKLEVPKWHLEKLKEAEKGIADGTDEFIDIDQFENELRQKIKERKAE